MLSREILEKLTNKQLIDAYLGLKYKYETLEAKYDILTMPKRSASDTGFGSFIDLLTVPLRPKG